MSKGPVRFKKQAVHLSDHRSPTGVLADKLVGQTETVKKGCLSFLNYIIKKWDLSNFQGYNQSS